MWMNALVLFERSSLHLMGKRRVGKGSGGAEIGVGGGELAG